MDTRFREIAAWFEALSPATLADIDSIYAPEALFRDPFNEIKGCGNIRKIYQHMFDQTQQPRFSITSIVEQGCVAFMIWDFHFSVRGRSFHIHGCTHFVLNDAGLILAHRDYWDAAQELYEKLPLLGGLLRLIKRRLSVSG